MQFHIGDILSVTTGRLLSLKKIGGIYEILNFMCQEEFSTHQLPRASDICKPFLVKQFPWSEPSNFDLPNFQSEQQVWDWVNMIAEVHGTYHEVQPLDVAYPAMEPVDELTWMRGSDEGIVVVGAEKNMSPQEAFDRGVEIARSKDTGEKPAPSRIIGLLCLRDWEARVFVNMLDSLDEWVNLAIAIDRGQHGFDAQRVKLISRIQILLVDAKLISDSDYCDRIRNSRI